MIAFAMLEVSLHGLAARKVEHIRVAVEQAIGKALIDANLTNKARGSFFSDIEVSVMYTVGSDEKE